MSTVTQAEAIALCAVVESFAPSCGCHVALTGGTLYKHGPRKDVDLLFYRIRQVEKIDYTELFHKLWELAGVYVQTSHGWVTKAVWGAVSVDLFFPEADDAPGALDPTEYNRARVKRWLWCAWHRSRPQRPKIIGKTDNARL